MTRFQKINTNRSWTKCSYEVLQRMGLRLAADKGGHELCRMRMQVPPLPPSPYEKPTKKQTSNNDMSLMKDLFKEILPQLPMEAQEKLKTSYSGLDSGA